MNAPKQVLHDAVDRLLVQEGFLSTCACFVEAMTPWVRQHVTPSEVMNLIGKLHVLNQALEDIATLLKKGQTHG